MARKTFRFSLLALGACLIAGPALAQDADGDGVSDASDVYPCDPNVAGARFIPGEGVFGSLAFEDEWPAGYSDDDFNDLFVAWNIEHRLTPDGRVARLRAVLHVLAVGGTYDNGLGLHVPAPTGAQASITRTVAGTTTNLTPSAADGELTFDISSDVREFFGQQAGQINAVASDPALTSPPIVVEIVFSTPVSMGVDGPHDLFLFRTQDRGHEIHRPEFSGTASMNGALFGTGIDGSTAGRNFVDTYGTPYALVFPGIIAYPQEGMDLAMLYPDLVGFASSGGQSNADFYTSTIVPSYGYAPAQTATFVAPPAIDSACVVTVGPSCLAILQAGQSTGDGVYTLDFDGAGPLAPFDVYCDMTTQGGGWTLVEVIRSGYHTTTGATNPTALPGRTTHAKLNDADIRTLATNGSLQAMVRHTSSTYIQRYSASEWGSFNSRGWRNVTWDSMRPDGTWANGACNGHYNNRGFSTYSDRNRRACPVVYSGGARYMTTWHTYNYSGGVGGVYDVFVR